VTITLTNAQSTPATAHLVAAQISGVNVATGGTACGGGVDFLTSDQVVTIPANTTQTTAFVTICGDTALEGTETFGLFLAQVQGAACFGDGCGAYGIIKDNESFPRMSINDASVLEGDLPNLLGLPGSFMQFTVTLSAATSDPVTVQYRTVGRTATEGTDCRQSGVDFVHTSGTLSFAGGQTSKTVNVGVCGDIFPEPNENFTVQLFNAQFATLSDSVGVGTIVNDD